MKFLVKFCRRTFLIGTLIVAILGGIGSAYGAVTLEAQLSLTETYTDNLFFEDTNKEEDFGTFISPFLTLSYLSRDVNISGTYGGSLQLYANNSDTNGFFHFANFSLDLPFLTKRYDRLEVRLIESPNFTPSLTGFSFSGEPGDPNVTPAGVGGATGATGATGAPGGIPGGGNVGSPGGSNVNIPGRGSTGNFGTGNLGNQGVFTRRERSGSVLQNLAGFDIRYRLLPQWTPSFTYRNRLLKFFKSNQQDSMSHNLGTRLEYVLSAVTRLNLNYNANIVDFQGSRQGQNADDFITHSVTMGGSHSLSPTLSLNGNFGVSITESRTNLNANVGFSQVFKRGTITTRYNQAITPGGGEGNSATLSQGLTATGSYFFTERFEGFLSAGAAKNESLSGNTLDLKSLQGQGGITYQFLSWLFGSARYSYIFQDSKGTTGRDAIVHQGFLTLQVVPQAWRIVR